MRDPLVKGDPRNYLYTLYDRQGTDWWCDSFNSPWSYEYIFDRFRSYNDFYDVVNPGYEDEHLTLADIDDLWEVTITPVKRIIRRNMQNKWHKLMCRRMNNERFRLVGD